MWLVGSVAVHLEHTHWTSCEQLYRSMCDVNKIIYTEGLHFTAYHFLLDIRRHIPL